MELQIECHFGRDTSLEGRIGKLTTNCLFINEKLHNFQDASILSIKSLYCTILHCKCTCLCLNLQLPPNSMSKVIVTCFSSQLCLLLAYLFIYSCMYKNIQKAMQVNKPTQCSLVHIILKQQAFFFQLHGSKISRGERGGSVVECRTPEREVGGSKPTAAVLCP